MATPTPLPIEAVLFDYGMVLSGPPDPAAWTQMQAITGFDEATLDHAYWAPRHAYDRGDLTGQQYWQTVGQAGGTTLSPEQLTALIDADTALWTRTNDPMIAWADRLQRAGIRTGILSNLGDAMTLGVVGKFAWIEAFHHRLWSHTLKLAKPEAAIYHHAITGLGVTPEHILFIDDRENNVEAGRAAGMQVIRYLDHAAFEQELIERGWGHLWMPEPRP
ncbi:HAD family phosphatase [Granulicella sp. WH15]|uniref:HAD family hydrolase n=1 Tax=Granulicella sp. WH15 TaxID=2602070 RepID=UPI0013674C1C|nr:HAD family phosphatase [Granulicella sp. WH15]QHN03534.1 HAD family phosphatase [Granulicella sp. WH15]